IMAYKLVKGVYSVRCRHPGCPFHVQIKIDSNLMGMTQADVELEAHKLAKDMAFTQHDAVYGVKHPLEDPDIHRVGGTFRRIGAVG
ncbi:MAG: hypothetical protein JXR77_03105, partial [Lentisphaeria bacterium]|nr:hypothetical protein [Lentisphaeria bacterium]